MYPHALNVKHFVFHGVLLASSAYASLIAAPGNFARSIPSELSLDRRQSCPVGFGLCAGISCISPERSCCTDGSSCDPGFDCFVYLDNPDDIFCRPGGSGPIITTVTEELPAVTTPPQIPDIPDQIIFTTYTFTYTWFYAAYFYTIFDFTTTLFSTTRTTTLFFTVSATAESAASASADVLAASATATPPADASAELATLPPPTATPVPTLPSVVLPTVTPTASPPPFLGDAARLGDKKAWIGAAAVAMAIGRNI